jgi:hypothetical protein
MDKWKLLRSALQGKRESDSAASIHRNDGIFSVIEKQFTNWEWVLNITVEPNTTLETLKQECRQHMLARDIVELSLRLSASDSNPADGKVHLQELLTSAVEAGCCRFKQEGGSIGEDSVTEVYWQDASITLFMPQCKYYQWTLPCGQVLHARYQNHCSCH